MRARTRLIIVLALLAVLVGTLSTTAGAGVERYQLETYTMDITAVNAHPEWGHFYQFTNSPCDGSWTADQAYIKAAGPIAGEETVTGISLAGGNITFTSLYTGTYNPGYSYHPTISLNADHSITLVSSNGGVTSVQGTWAVTSTDHKNHGQYVKEMGGGADAAHSCIGMPIVSHGHSG